MLTERSNHQTPITSGDAPRMEAELVNKLNPSDDFELSGEVYLDPEIDDDHYDEFACLDLHDCDHPGGHIWLRHQGEERCIHCKRKPGQ